MKQIYFAAFAAILSTAVTAQGLLPAEASKTSQLRRVEAVNPAQSVEREVIWSHDCSVESCSDWTFGNGSEEVGSPWEGIDFDFRRGPGRSTYVLRYSAMGNCNLSLFWKFVFLKNGRNLKSLAGKPTKKGRASVLSSGEVRAGQFTFFNPPRKKGKTLESA